MEMKPQNNSSHSIKEDQDGQKRSETYGCSEDKEPEEMIESSAPSSSGSDNYKPKVFIEDAQPLTVEGIKKICQVEDGSDDDLTLKGGNDEDEN